MPGHPPNSCCTITRGTRKSTSDRALATLCLLMLGAPAGAELVWHWEDRFDGAEQARLREWVSTVAESVEGTVAPYPFDVHIHIYRSAADSPVAWANTIRSGRQGVNVHVNPDYARADLLSDWTLYHELAHLFLPFLGRQHSWFAEGFASYMQYQLMHSAGVRAFVDCCRFEARDLDALLETLDRLAGTTVFSGSWRNSGVPGDFPRIQSCSVSFACLLSPRKADPMAIW